MRYQWTIGTTTVRNPDRLRDGLQILKEVFENKDWNTSQQEKFFNLLVDKGVYEMEKDDFLGMSANRKQEHARKWLSVLNQLGFCFAYEGSGKPVMVTEAGHALLDHPEIEEEIFLRQLLKYQKPSVLPKQNGASFEKVSVLPFIASLQIIKEVGSLSKEEISVFLNTTVRMDDMEKTIKSIKEYRAKRDQIEGNVKRREFYVRFQRQRLEEIFIDELKERGNLIKKIFAESKKDNDYLHSSDCKTLLNAVVKSGKGSNTKKAKAAALAITRGIKSGTSISIVKNEFTNYYLSLKIATLKDYADLTARYLRKSGLFSINRNRLTINSEKEDLIGRILSQKWSVVEDSDYLDYLWSSSLPTLPSDEADYLKKHLGLLIKREKDLFERVGKRESLEMIGQNIKPATSILQLKQQTKKVEDNLLKLKEVDFYYTQREEEQIDDIINFYDLIINKQILGGEAYYPAYLEWNTWRVFLAIDTLSNKPYEARNFKIDEELQPINHAPGNRADMVFEYDNFTLVTEVTLIVRANQYSAEAEPVPRHVAKVHYENKDKEVFGIFVAPEIDMNTVLAFFKNKHAVEKEILDLTIIPFSINQIKNLLAVFKLKRFSTQDLKRLLNSIKSEMHSSRSAMEWYEKIPTLINEWQENL